MDVGVPAGSICNSDSANQVFDLVCKVITVVFGVCCLGFCGLRVTHLQGQAVAWNNCSVTKVGNLPFCEWCPIVVGMQNERGLNGNGQGQEKGVDCIVS